MTAFMTAVTAYRAVTPHTREVAVEVSADVLEEELARVNITQFIVVDPALRQLLEQVPVHEPLDRGEGGRVALGDITEECHIGPLGLTDRHHRLHSY